MLGLKLPTDPRWVNIVEKNIDEICKVKSLDGVLVGGASTDIKKLNVISQALQDNY